MSSKAKKLVAQIAAGKNIPGAAATLNSMRMLYPRGDRDFESAVSAEIMSTASGLINLVDKVAAEDVETKMLLFHLLLPETGSAIGLGNEDPRTPLARAVIASKHSTAITQTFTADLSSRDGHTRYRACMVLEALTSQPDSIAISRIASEAGAIPKLIALAENPPNPAVMPYPLIVLDYLCSNSTTRSKEAVKAGAMKMLAIMLDDPDIKQTAVISIGNILRHVAPSKKTPKVTQKIITGMASVLGTPGPGNWQDNEYKLGALQILLMLQLAQPDELSSSITAALLHERSMPGIAQGAKLGPDYFIHAAKVVSMCLVAPSGPPEDKKRLAAAAAQAGLMDAGLPCLSSTDPASELAASNAVLLLRCLGDYQGPEWLLQHVSKLPATSLDAVMNGIKQGMDSAAKAGSCARCGATEGSGKGGSLLHCSQCRNVHYCSADCQRADWKSHKLRCKNYVDHSSTGGPGAHEPIRNKYLYGSQGASSSGSSSSSSKA